MIWLRMLLYAVVGMVVFVLSTSLTVRFLLTDETTVTCPDLGGLDLDEAKRAAAQAGLSVTVEKYETRMDVPYNRVVRQLPDATTPVKAGRVLTVVLSDGPVPVIIPSLVGLSVDTAEAELQEHAMKIKKTVYVPGGEKNRVLAQSPGAGENILDPEGIVLVVGGRGERFYMMPDIIGTDRVAVVREMEEKGIRYSIGSVIGGQDPSAGWVLRSQVPPRTIFGSDTVIELQIANGG
jgi:serine/threonine-protein kinase